MKKISTIVLLMIIIFSSHTVIAQGYVDIELFLMRKGVKVFVVLQANTPKIPKQLAVERKTTAPLSTYRRIITLNEENLIPLHEEGKLLLSDDFPESRQSESYYRVSYITEDSVLTSLPAVFLAKASDDPITFGDHKQDASMFEVEEDPNIPTYEKFNIEMKVFREEYKVFLSLFIGKKLEGELILERKSEKALSSFRKIKVFNEEEKAQLFKEKFEFQDRYPESIQVDSYYRLVLFKKDGTVLEFPSIYLDSENSK